MVYEYELKEGFYKISDPELTHKLGLKYNLCFVLQNNQKSAYVVDFIDSGCLLVGSGNHEFPPKFLEPIDPDLFLKELTQHVQEFIKTSKSKLEEKVKTSA